MQKKKSLIYALIPALVVLLGLSLRWVSGPFWLGHNSDPEYQYLFNALAIVEGLPVGHVDHPGAGLQFLGASIIVIMKGFFSSPIPNCVLDQPEPFLAAFHFTLLCIVASGIYMLGRAAHKSLGFYALLVQASVFLGPGHYVLQRSSPDILLLGLGFWAVATTCLHAHSKNNSQIYLLITGLLCGWALATKINFIPFILFPLICFNGSRKRLIFFGSTCISALLLLCNAFVPLGGFLYFMKIIVSREGYNAPVTEGANLFQAMFEGVGLFIHQIGSHHMLLLVLVIGGSMIGLFTLKDDQKLSLKKWVWAGLITFILQFILVINGPKASSHYLVPAIPAIGFCFVMFMLVLETLTPPTARKNVLYFSTALILLLFGWKIKAEYQKRHQLASGWMEIEKLRQNKYQDIPTIYYYRATGVPFALYEGAMWSQGKYFLEVKKRFPNTSHFDRWQQHFVAPNAIQRELELEKVKHWKTFITIGSPNYRFEPPFGTIKKRTVIAENSWQKMVLFEMND